MVRVGRLLSLDQVFEIEVGGGDNVMTEYLGDLKCGFNAGPDCYLDIGDLAAKPHRDQPGTDLLDAVQLDLGRFGRGIGGFYNADETAGLDQSYRGQGLAGVVDGVGD